MQQRLKATINPLGHRTSYAYDAFSNQIRVQDPLGNITTSVFDSQKRLKATINVLGQRTSYAYNGAGSQIREQNPLGRITTTVYDVQRFPLWREVV